MGKEEFNERDKLILMHQFEMEKLQHVRESEMLLMERRWELENYTYQPQQQQPQLLRSIASTTEPERIKTPEEISAEKYRRGGQFAKK